ncbi:MAG TPA: PP2C family serine/threonine-protein phosphatase [Actinoplanes sp.]|nr:PP2C family serine/threonine-protein phosphatase [Actinoplanes sp.]
MTVALRYAVRSDRGLMRTNNEDSVYAGPRLLALADGMGGHAAGEVASNVVISALAHLDEDRPIDDLISTLRDATADANNHLRDLVIQDPNLDGMGTTLTALLVAGQRVGLVHVGDSRAYLVRGGQLSQITHDDTFVQALIDEGRLTEEEASSHPQRSLILHALNGSDVEPDLSIREVRIGDRYLLCSDGLSDVVSPDTLLEALQLPDPHESADRLVELALRAGGPDNVTCIVADVIDVPYGDDAPVMDGAVGGPRPQREPGPTSPASRAATLHARPEPTDTVPSETARPRRRRLRIAFVSLAVLALLGAGSYGLWRWTQAQYFVGAEGGQVAVYRGINTALGPVHLYSVVDTSPMRLDDLTQVARRQVQDGIPADNRAEADQILRNLSNQQKPLCPPTPAPSPTPARTAKPPAGRPTTPAPTTAPASPTPAPGDEGCRNL